MAIQIKKTLLGKLIVAYDCPGCGERLRSNSDQVGTTDDCPACQFSFVVPGEQELKRFLYRVDAVAVENARAAARNASLKSAQAAEKAESERVAKEKAAKEKERQRLNAAAELIIHPEQQQSSFRPSYAPNRPLQPKSTMRRCPFCAEEIIPGAIKCKHCGEFLDGRPKVPEVIIKSNQGISCSTGCLLILIIVFSIFAASVIMAFF